MMKDRTHTLRTGIRLTQRLLVFQLMVLMATSALAAAPIELIVKTAVTIDHEQVRVADLASLSGDDPAQLQSLGETVVANSPLPGQSRFVSLDYIRIRLRQAGIDPDAILFRGAEDVQLTRAAATLPIEAVKRAVEAAIRSQMPWKNEDATISDISVDETIQLPTGVLSYRIVPNRNEDYLGRTILALHLFVNDEPFRKIWVNATVSVEADVVSVVRPLGKHQTIERADLSVVRRDLANLASDTVRSVEEVVGTRTTQVIYPDTVLQTSMIVAPPLVRRGDIVKIVANAGSMTITATGMVKQQGGKGDLVRVINTDSNRIITARVTGPGAVEVDF